MCACAIVVLHEQWMCLGIQRNTHITGNNLIPISVPIHFVDGSYMHIRVSSVQEFSYLLLPIAYEGEGRDGYRDQIITCDVGVSLNSKTHPLFMKYSNGTSTVLCISLSELVSCAFSTIPICPFLIFHSLVIIEMSNKMDICSMTIFLIFTCSSTNQTTTPPCLVEEYLSL